MSTALRTQSDKRLSHLADIEAIDYYFACQFAEITDSIPFYLLVALSWHLRQGHTCLSLADIAGKRLFDDAEQHCEGVQFDDLTTLVKAARELSEQFGEPQQLVYHRGKLYTARYWQFELTVAEGVVSRTRQRAFSDDDYDRLHQVWPQLFPTMPTLEQDWQQVATACALTRDFAVINGGPGTGKTYTVARLLLALQAASDKPLTIKLAAPTGKAAQRLTESVSNSLHAISGDSIEGIKQRIVTEASTLHRLLGMRPFSIKPKHHSDNLIHCDVLIIDEASMVDLALMTRVFRALPASTSVYLVGDANQLPSVESGNVLEALTPDDDSHDLKVTDALAKHVHRLCPHLPGIAVDEHSLTTVFPLKVSQRYSGKLAEVAVAMRDGDGDRVLNLLTRTSEPVPGLMELEDVVLMPVQQGSGLRKLIKDSFAALSQANSPASALEAMNHCRWLTPVRNGEGGVNTLNEEIERVLQPNRTAGNNGHYIGRPIMVLENDYTQRLFNGDTGVIWPDDSQQLKAWFYDRHGELRAVSLSRLPSVQTVYAMTIHKSQGSEFRNVVMWLPPAQGKAASMVTRELIYTGLTRAKKGCVILAAPERVSAVIQTRAVRYSGLAERIDEKWAGA